MPRSHRPSHPRLPYATHLAAGTAAGVLAASVVPATLIAVALCAGSILGGWACLRLAMDARGRVLLWTAVGLGLGLVRAIGETPATLDDDHISAHLADWPQRLPVRLSACLGSGPRRTRSGWQAVAEVHALTARDSEHTGLSGSLRLIWRDDGFRPVTGECFEVSGTAVATEPDLQPFGWSSRKADQRAGVSGRVFLDEDWSGRLLAPIRRIPSSAPVWQRVEALVDRHRLQMEDGVLESSPERGAGWVLAVGAGSRAGLDGGDRDMMTRAGIAHLLAVSGLHLALFVLSVRRLLEWVLSRFTTLLRLVERRTFGAAAVIPLAWLYVVFTGSGTAAVRAALFVTCLSAAELSGRRASLAGAIGLSVTAILLANPAELYGPSFQLSLSAVAGIAIATRRVGARPAALAERRRFGWARAWSRKIATLARASLGASLATAPVLAHHFGVVSLSGLFANVAVAPLLAVTLVPLAGAALLVAPAEPRLAAALCELIEHTVDLSFALLDPLTRWMRDPWVTGRPLALEAACFVLALVCLAAARHPGRLRRTAATRALQWLGLGLLLSMGRLWPPPALELWSIPVGQGDSTLIRTPTGHTVIIDTGGGPGGIDPGRSVIVPLLRGLGVRQIDLAVITHGDVDHVGGLRSVLQAYRVRELWWGGAVADIAADRDLRRALERADTAVRMIAESPRRRFEIGPVAIEILHPAAPSTASLSSHRGDNNDSVCLMVSFDERRALLPGDVEQIVEDRLAGRYGLNLRADILKVPHHGSRSSSSPPLVSRVMPGHVVYSVGPANRFGFPHADVMARYRALGARAYRTDRDGLVRFRLSREGVGVRTWGAGRLVPVFR